MSIILYNAIIKGIRVMPDIIEIFLFNFYLEFMHYDLI